MSEARPAYRREVQFLSPKPIPRNAILPWGSLFNPLQLCASDDYSRLVDRRDDFVNPSSSAVGVTCRPIQKHCLAEAIRCIELARRAKTLEGRQTFQFLADRWKGLAADLEKAEASLERLNENGFRRSPTYPYD